MVRISLPAAETLPGLSNLLSGLSSNAPHSTEAAIKLVSNFTPAALVKSNDVVVTHGEGSWVFTACGRRLLDFASGIGVNSTGHSHPRVVAAVQRQAARIVHAQQNIFAAHDQMVEFLPLLHSVLPYNSQLNHVLLANSGAEAVENAVKVARAATGRPHVIAFDGGFHGRTMGTMALTSSKNVYKKGFGPLMPGVLTAPYPYCLHCKTQQVLGLEGYPLLSSLATDNDSYSSRAAPTPLPRPLPRSCCGSPIESLEWMLKMQVAPEDVAAVILEPIQGEGGFLTPPPGFLAQLRRICTAHGILLILDEVQSGVGRTGKWWGMQHFLDGSDPDLAPDIMTFAKGIASGFPLSGLAFKSNLVDAAKLPPGSVGGTYGGNAVCTAAAIATIQAIKEEGMLANAAARGEQLVQGLLRGRRERGLEDVIDDIRGRGLMIGVELETSVRIVNAGARESVR
eukprot:CAMPEP_0175046636 /NCGR_PEP_ID=MMETSP0052_2-20121109/5141_1 /TAXON_ID=51329 ORGANISM="Polytomella parva, Strain SAG 63-3" /NCGR_SAMPLE_ID=MMETSP0052_2 /ASSEMBLY_ACC=CAM_ASM_000194 /LENGTH=453 /DNA_ID=CAMNT_0016310405 /DNA_START=80 /DNA_END=1439 /DNA_ORIENTATION=+